MEWAIFSESVCARKASWLYYITFALRADSDIRKASDFVITTERLGFVLTKEVNVFLLRVHLVANKCTLNG